MNRIVKIITLICITVASQAQEKVGKPDIPGSLLIDIGFNFLQNEPKTMDIKFFGSKTVNFYYQYDIPFGTSKFSFHPGIGLAFDNFRFDKDLVLNHRKSTNTSSYITTMDTLKTLFPNASSFVKSKLAMTYLEMPLEFRFHANPNDKKRSFKVSVGGRIGLRVSSHTKVKYEEDGNTVKIKNKQNFGLSSFRYGTTLRVGIGWFGLFYYHNLSDMFQKGKGPAPNASISNFTVGLTIAGF